MRFSIIIPTFNRPRLLSQAIESALAQTYSDREIVVIDDGSTDSPREVVLSYGQQIRYLRQENQGKASALNAGIRATSGDAIIVLDDDDFFPCWTLAKHVEALERNPAAEFSYGRFGRFRGETPPVLSELQDIEYVPTRDPRRLVVKLMENCFLPNPSWAVRRSAQLKAGLYEDCLHFSQDYDMILRLARRNEGVFVDDVVLLQRKHLSRRGPMSDSIYILDTIDKWIKDEAWIFQKIDDEWGVADFQPFPDALPSLDNEAWALLQKGVILFQRKAYERAARVLAQYRTKLGAQSPARVELKIAAGLLGCRYGIADLVADRTMGDKVAQWLGGGNWPLLMRMAFASQQRWRIRGALSMGDARYALQIVQFSRKAFGLAATAAVLGSRYSAGARAWRGSN